MASEGPTLGLHEAGIELILANQQAKTIAQARLAVALAIISVRGRPALISPLRFTRSRSPTKFLDRTESDTVGFAQSAVDGPGFRHAHLGTVNQ